MSSEELFYSTSFYLVTFPAASCIAFLVLFRAVSLLSTALCQGYRQLSWSQKLDFDCRVVSSIHATVAGLTSLYLCLFDDQLQDVAWGHSHLALLTCSFLAGYMVADVLMIAWYYETLWSTVFVAHHVWVFVFECFVILGRKCVWLMAYRQVAELSTPFINGRALLDAIGYPKSSKLFIINGVLMAASFFLVRVATIPFYYYVVYDLYRSGHTSATLGFMWYVAIFGGTFLDILNVYWFRKILRGIINVLQQLKTDKTH